MTSYSDFSEYDYLEDFVLPGCVNIGWLGDKVLKSKLPSVKFLDRLWEYCGIEVARSRGVYSCEICETCDSDSIDTSQRNGIERLLGTAEIRVFSGQGRIFAAPNLIYHYVAIHHYAPPNEFVTAVLRADNVTSESYRTRLELIDPDWKLAKSIQEPLKVYRL